MFLTLPKPPTRLILRVALSLLLLAFALLVLLKVLLWLSVPYLPMWLAWLSLGAMFCAFSLVASAGFFVAIRAIVAQFAGYFSAPQREQRRVLAILSHQRRQSDLFPLKTAQIQYFHELKKRKLQSSDNRRQILALSRAIAKDLTAAKNCLPRTVIKELQWENRESRKRQDETALIKLQEKIAQLTQTCRE